MRRPAFLFACVSALLLPAVTVYRLPRGLARVELAQDLTLTALGSSGGRTEGRLRAGTILCVDDPALPTEGSTRMRLVLRGRERMDPGIEQGAWTPIYGGKGP